MGAPKGSPDRGAARIHRHARQLAEAYCDPGQFKTAQEFLEAITEGLDELARAMHMDPPKDIPELFGIAV